MHVLNKVVVVTMAKTKIAYQRQFKVVNGKHVRIRRGGRKGGTSKVGTNKTCFVNKKSRCGIKAKGGKRGSYGITSKRCGAPKTMNYFRTKCKKDKGK